MKNKLLILGICLSCTSTLFSQESSYKLQDYVNPTYKRKALDLDFNLGGNFRETDYSKNNYLGGDFGLKYDMVSNSEKEQTHTYGDLSGSLSSDKQEYTKLKQANVGFSFTRESFFFFKKKTFFEVTPSAFLTYRYIQSEEKNKGFDFFDNQTIYGDSFDKRNTLGTSINIKLGIGNGRIENVSDARQAMYILQDLQKKGLLKKTLTNDEVNALAEEITLIKNKRQYDLRIKLTEEITLVDSFLVANDFIEKDNSALYFTTLYDKWVYGDRQKREAGSYIKGGVAPRYSFGDSRYDYTGIAVVDGQYQNYLIQNKSTYVTSDYGAALYVDYKYEKPISLSLQSSFSANLSAGVYKDRDSEKDFYNSNLDFGYTLGYYPNTRTYLSAGIHESLFWDKMYRDLYSYYEDASGNITLSSDERRVNQFNTYTYLSIAGYYYLSPQLRLFGSCNFSYNYNYMTDRQDSHDKYPAINFQLGLSYALF